MVDLKSINFNLQISFLTIIIGFIVSLIDVKGAIAGYSLIICALIGLVVIIFAALFGTFIPLTLKTYSIDPALATGPFITTVNDVLGLFIYFWIGQAIT